MNKINIGDKILDWIVLDNKSIKIGSSYKIKCQCNCGIGKQKRIGAFNNPTEAFYAYKKFKENYIKQVADKYKNEIAKNVYEAMYNYKVEITD